MGFIAGMQECYNIHESIHIIHHINKIKDKNYEIVSLDALDKVQHPFMIFKKRLSKMGVEGAYNKGHIQETYKPTSYSNGKN